MKHRILLAGMQDTIIDDFFMHTTDSFECMTCSTRPTDLQLHLRMYEPEVFVYCLGRDEKSGVDAFTAARRVFTGSDCIIVIVGDSYVIEDAMNIIEGAADVVLTKPISILKIQQKIIDAIDEHRIQEEIRMREEQKRLEEEEKQKQEEAKNTKKHILVVDDDPVMLRTIKHYLEEKYVVATAPSGKFATKFLSIKETDLVLLDYEMPEMSGPQVFDVIKSSEKTAHIPVVFLTGISDTSKIRTVLAMQPQGYLLKPVDYERLHQTLDGILGQ